VVNDTFARKYLDGNPIGKRLRLDGQGPWVEVVGVTVTGKYISMTEPPADFLYLPLSQNPQSRISLIGQAAGDPAALAAPLRQLVGSIDPNLSIFAVRTMDDVFYQGATKYLRLTSGAFASAALIGFFLAVVGLYAVVAYRVARRTREIGIRMALGAERPQVMRMILNEAGAMALLGISIGFALNLAVGPALASGTRRPADPAGAIFVPAGLLLTTLLAAAIPARRAARIDPQQALRQD